MYTGLSSDAADGPGALREGELFCIQRKFPDPREDLETGAPNMVVYTAIG